MIRAKNFLRRRQQKPTAEEQKELFSSESVERSGMSLRTTDRTISSVEGVNHPFVAHARRRRGRLAALTFPSADVSPSDLTLDQDMAESITRSMTQKWFGVDLPAENQDLMPSVSSETGLVRSWLEKSQPTAAETPFVDAESRPERHVAARVRDSSDSTISQTVAPFTPPTMSIGVGVEVCGEDWVRLDVSGFQFPGLVGL